MCSAQRSFGRDRNIGLHANTFPIRASDWIDWPPAWHIHDELVSKRYGPLRDSRRPPVTLTDNRCALEHLEIVRQLLSTGEGSGRREDEYGLVRTVGKIPRAPWF